LLALQIQTKKRTTLSKRFKCPFCANEETVECKMDFKAGIGSLECRLCAASYQMPIHHLHEPVDVFSEWLDDCEAAAQGKQTNTQTTTSAVPRYESEDSDSDTDLPAASGLTTTNTNNSTNKNNKASAQASDNANKEDARPSYTDLGLDDSDDDSDDD
jgi:transcription elongation factor Elf1